MTYSEWTCRTMCVCHFNRVFTPANSKLLGQIGTNIERIEIKCDKMGCYNNLYFVYWFRIAPNNNVKQLTLENCSLHFDLIPPLDQCIDVSCLFDLLGVISRKMKFMWCLFVQLRVFFVALNLFPKNRTFFEKFQSVLLSFFSPQNLVIFTFLQTSSIEQRPFFESTFFCPHFQNQVFSPAPVCQIFRTSTA